MTSYTLPENSHFGLKFYHYDIKCQGKAGNAFEESSKYLVTSIWAITAVFCSLFQIKYECGLWN